MMKYKFYDTCSLLAKVDHLWEPDEIMCLSDITLNELEHIKNATNKDAEIKYAARKLLQELDKHLGDYEIAFYKDDYTRLLEEQSVSLSNDVKIVLCAYAFFDHRFENKYFITNDLHCKVFAQNLLPQDITIESYYEEPYSYKGYKDITFSDDEMTELYSDLEKNIYGLLINEYLIVRDKDNNIVDKMCWTGERLRPVQYYTFSSSWFGDVKPIKNDQYQAMAFDSLMNNKITMIKGQAGSGKSYTALAYLFSKLERGKIDKIIIFCNTVAAKNAARLGFLPGDKNSKLLDSQIGNFLSSKLGSQLAVQRLLDDEKIVLIPASDMRGYDTSGMNAGIYITEAQNMDIELMKLALQRIGEDSVCVIEGDYNTQTDMVEYSGSNNGMRRVSQVFRGADFYGEITLEKIHRGRIAERAELM